MSETEGKAGEEDEERPHLRHPGIWFGVFLIGILIALNVGLGLTGHVIPAPRWAVDRIEARANAALGGTLTAKVGGAELIVDERFVPHVRIKAVELFGRGGARLALLPDLRTTLKAGPILRGKLEPRTLSIYGAQIAIRRRVDGQFDVDLARDGGAPVAGTAMTPADLARAVDEAFELPVLSGIEKITVEGLGLDYRDDRAGRSWIASGGWLALDQDAARLGIDLGVALVDEGKVDVLIVSGDNTAEHHHETTNMRRYLQREGVASAAIVEDEHGLDTYDTCVRTREVFGVTSAVLVSQSYHLPRAIATCRAVGVDAIGVGDTSVKETSRRWGEFSRREIGANLKMVVDLVSRRQPSLDGPRDAVTQALGG